MIRHRRSVKRKAGRFDLFGPILKWLDAVEAGADPIEALHGHYCGPRCWHWETLPEHEKEKLRKAPWNQG